jgi:urease accessory protein
MAVGYLWSWLENQIAAATKLIPLGQSTAQRLLVVLGEEVTQIIEQSQQVSDTEIGSSLPGLAMASSGHETQYSRLFRS